MASKGEIELTTEELAAYLEGEVTASEARRIEQRLVESSGARRRLASLQNIRDALVQPNPELRDVDLVSSLHAAMAQAAPSTVESRRSRRLSSLPWIAAAASVGVLVGLAAQQRFVGMRGRISGDASLVQSAESAVARPDDDEFREKSASSRADPARWVGVQIYRVHRGGRPERVLRSISRGDGLLFTYTNLGSEAFEYLMIFAVDERGEVRWFHPAYEIRGANPESIAIRKGEADVPLPELIQHDLALGSLKFHALFSKNPLKVLSIESLVARRPPDVPVALPNVVDHVITVQVEP